MSAIPSEINPARKTMPARWCAFHNTYHENTSNVWHQSVLDGRSTNVWCRAAHAEYYQSRKADLAARKREESARLRSMSCFEINALIRAKRKAGEPVPVVLIDRLGVEVRRLRRALLKA